VLLLLAFGLWIVGLVNAYNFMDGIDGLAGGQAIVAASGWVLVGILTGQPALTGAACVLAAACAAFLRFNWSPARVFMGDVGSAFLGFAFAVLPLSTPSPVRFVLAGACFMWPFLFDTCFTLIRRLLRRENVLQAHRSHLYQRLIGTGVSHAHVTSVYLMLAALGLPAALCFASGRWVSALMLTGAVPAGAAALWYATVRREAAGARMIL
jgi:UDP-N-acetylmuramyl pentapeptide phosphotransferase/UDP-N-acetylglucosamine-1-phosphate transferase